MSLNTLRRFSLALAEAVDAHRVVPRAILIAYAWMVWLVTRWYISIPTANSTTCQNDVLVSAFEQGATIEQARALACSVAASVGGPTSEQTMFVSIIVGLSSVVIGLYLNTGNRSKWQGDVLQNIAPTPAVGRPTPIPHSNGPFMPESEEDTAAPAQGSWLQRIRGKAAPKAQMPEPPDLGEDSYQG